MYQKLTIEGNVGRDPEMRYLHDGRPVTSLSVASNRKWNDKATGVQKEETTWFRVSVFGNQAEAVNQYVTKGRQVLVEGRLNPDATTGSPRLFTRQDGSVGAAYEIVATRCVSWAVMRTGMAVTVEPPGRTAMRKRFRSRSALRISTHSLYI